MAKKRKTKRRPRIGTQVETQPIKMYEYDYAEIQVGISKDEILAQLNAMGAQGWLAFHAFSSGGFYHFTFAREVV